MDINKNSISYASFITKIYCWLVLYLKRKRALKYIPLLLVVLFCTLTRYVVLSLDKAEVKQAKMAPINLKLVKLPPVSTKTILKSSAMEVKQSYRYQIKPLNFKKAKRSSLFIYALD